MKAKVVVHPYNSSSCVVEARGSELLPFRYSEFEASWSKMRICFFFLNTCTLSYLIIIVILRGYIFSEDFTFSFLVRGRIISIEN